MQFYITINWNKEVVSLFLKITAIGDCTPGDRLDGIPALHCALKCYLESFE